MIPRVLVHPQKLDAIENVLVKRRRRAPARTFEPVPTQSSPGVYRRAKRVSAQRVILNRLAEQNQAAQSQQRLLLMGQALERMRRG